MALFNREDENPDVVISTERARASRGQQPSSGGRNTYIGPGVKIKGEISADVEMVVDGEVQGSMELQQNLTVGPKGVVKGDIAARTVQVSGSVVGNVRGSERFELMPSGRIEGDVVSPRVVIAEGAFFKGKVEMSSQQAPTQTASTPAATTGPKPPESKEASQSSSTSSSASTGTETATGGSK